jgi:hypothetical protein
MFFHKVSPVVAAVAMCTLFSAPTPARAATYDFDVPIAGRTFQFGDAPIVVPFDLGTTFSEISSVQVLLEGKSHFGLAQFDGPGTEPSELLPILAVFLPNGDVDPPRNLTSLAHSDPTRWAASFVKPDPSGNSFYIPETALVNLDFLLDGKGELGIESALLPIGTPPDMSSIVDPYRAEFSQATLRISGTIVPEPSGAALAMLGVVALALGMRRTRISDGP